MKLKKNLCSAAKAINSYKEMVQGEIRQGLFQRMRGYVQSVAKNGSTGTTMIRNTM